MNKETHVPPQRKNPLKTQFRKKLEPGGDRLLGERALSGGSKLLYRGGRQSEKEIEKELNTRNSVTFSEPGVGSLKKLKEENRM